jgi:hypothetical protein
VASDLWHSAILNRVQAVEEGKTEGVAYEQVLDKVDAILKR